MNKIIYTILGLSILMTSCGKEAGESSEGEDIIFQKIHKTANGPSFEVVETKGENGKNKVEVFLKKFKKSNEKYSFGNINPIQKVLQADLDQDGFEEIYIVTKEKEGEQRSKVYGLASDKDLEVVPIKYASVKGGDLASDALFFGYVGNDDIQLENGELLNEFPTQGIDGTTGEKVKVLYKLYKGTDSWELSPEERMQ